LPSFNSLTVWGALDRLLQDYLPILNTARLLAWERSQRNPLSLEDLSDAGVFARGSWPVKSSFHGRRWLGTLGNPPLPWFWRAEFERPSFFDAR
jgi:hypothetical protein